MANELVQQIRLGDISFGIPEDMAALNRPWAFYEALGISKDAKREEIRRAYRRLSLQHHPDKGGDEKKFRNLARIAEILLDDGGELGQEHSQRRQYDEVSSLDSYFDEFITYEGERTKKLSEIMLMQMQGKRERAETELELAKKEPRFAELKEKFEQAYSDEEKERIAEEINDISARAAGLTPETREQVDKAREEAKKRFETRQREFVRSFKNSPSSYFSKILDIFYVGGGRVTFGQHMYNARIGLAAHEVKEHILELIIGGDCYIVGFSQVHFKSKQADVTISDPNVAGVFHVIKGNVGVDYAESSYGGVIRARAPDIRVLQGFRQRGDLYVPERFAVGNWWEKKPSLDIAVREGAITLQLQSPRIASKGSFLTISNSLEDFIKNNLYNNKKYF